MLFVLTNDLDTYHNLMNDVLFDNVVYFVFAYLYDIVIYSHIVNKHVEHLSMVLPLLRYAKIETCEFFQKEV